MFFRYPTRESLKFSRLTGVDIGSFLLILTVFAGVVVLCKENFGSWWYH